MTTSRPSSITWSLEQRRRGVLDGTWVAFRLSGLRVLRGRRGVLLGLFGLVPLVPVLVSFARGEAPVQGMLGFADTISARYFRMVNLVVCLFLAGAAIGEDIENKTMPLLLARAVPRAALLLGRYLAYVVSAWLLLAGCYLLCYGITVAPLGGAALAMGVPSLVAVLAALACAVAAHGAVFLLMSVLWKRAVFLGLIVFVWEANVSIKAPAIADFTVVHHVYVVLLHWTELVTFADLSGVSAEHPETLRQALVWLLGLVAVMLSLAVLRFRRKEYGG